MIYLLGIILTAAQAIVSMSAFHSVMSIKKQHNRINKIPHLIITGQKKKKKRVKKSKSAERGSHVRGVALATTSAPVSQPNPTSLVSPSKVAPPQVAPEFKWTLINGEKPSLESGSGLVKSVADGSGQSVSHKNTSKKSQSVLDFQHSASDLNDLTESEDEGDIDKRLDSSIRIDGDHNETSSREVSFCLTGSPYSNDQNGSRPGEDLLDPISSKLFYSATETATDFSGGNDARQDGLNSFSFKIEEGASNEINTSVSSFNAEGLHEFSTTSNKIKRKNVEDAINRVKIPEHLYESTFEYMTGDEDKTQNLVDDVKSLDERRLLDTFRSYLLEGDRNSFDESMLLNLSWDSLLENDTIVSQTNCSKIVFTKKDNDEITKECLDSLQIFYDLLEECKKELVTERSVESRNNNCMIKTKEGKVFFDLADREKYENFRRNCFQFSNELTELSQQPLQKENCREMIQFLEKISSLLYKNLIGLESTFGEMDLFYCFKKKFKDFKDISFHLFTINFNENKSCYELFETIGGKKRERSQKIKKDVI